LVTWLATHDGIPAALARSAPLTSSTCSGPEVSALPHSASWLNCIEAQFTALRHLCLDGTDHESHEAQAFSIPRYIAWRNRHAQNRMLRDVVMRANGA